MEHISIAYQNIFNFFAFFIIVIYFFYRLSTNKYYFPRSATAITGFIANFLIYIAVIFIYGHKYFIANNSKGIWDSVKIMIWNVIDDTPIFFKIQSTVILIFFSIELHKPIKKLTNTELERYGSNSYDRRSSGDRRKF